MAGMKNYLRLLLIATCLNGALVSGAAADNPIEPWGLCTDFRPWGDHANYVLEQAFWSEPGARLPNNGVWEDNKADGVCAITYQTKGCTGLCPHTGYDNMTMFYFQGSNTTVCKEVSGKEICNKTPPTLLKGICTHPRGTDGNWNCSGLTASEEPVLWQNWYLVLNGGGGWGGPTPWLVERLAKYGYTCKQTGCN